MGHKRRTMEMSGKCHKMGRTAVVFVLLGAIMVTGGIMAMAIGSAGAGTAARIAVNPIEQGPGAPAASKAEPKEKKAAVESGVIQPQSLEGTKDADQLAMAVGIDGCNADICYYKRSGKAWEMAQEGADIVGGNGITNQKTEGDGSTPSGIYGFTMVFGLRENPSSVLPRHKVTRGDYWVDDPASLYYNKLVNTSQAVKTWNSAGNMTAVSPYYNYTLALNCNEACEPGKGSVIFLHCFTAARNSGSAGCIRLSQEWAKELVQSATERTKITIAPDLKRLN